MGIPSAMREFLNRKYAVLEQQADAASQNAYTNTFVGRSAAGLDDVRAEQLPRTDAADIAEAGARKNLLREQAKYFGKTALADIDFTRSRINLTNEQTKTERGGNQAIGDISRQLRQYYPDPGQFFNF